MEGRRLRLLLAVVIGLLASGAAAASAVLELTSENFDGIVDGSSHVLVAFVAPWCGHSRSLAPSYARVADHFAAAFPGQAPHVRVARVNAALEPALAAAHGVDGYPTLKWYPQAAVAGAGTAAGGAPAAAAPQTLAPGVYAGVHAAATLAADVEARAGLVGGHRYSYVAYRAPQPAVQALSAATFDAVAHDPSRSTLVLFTAPWCTACATLAPVYERVAQVFADDADQVAVCSVDAEQERGLATRFDISGFPTLRLFPRDDGPAETYFLDDLDGGLFAAASSSNGGSSSGSGGSSNSGADEVSASAAEEAQFGAAVAALVAYVNRKAGTARFANGTLQPSAGRVPNVDRFLRTPAAAALFAGAADDTSAGAAALAALRQVAGSQTSADLYVAVLQKARARGGAWLQAEPLRLRGVAESGSVGGAQKTHLAKRRHVAQAVADAAALGWADLAEARAAEAAATATATAAEAANAEPGNGEEGAKHPDL